ncbi:MAG: hypothetical protein WAW37_05000 [Syntrophobacteraceae bacterium]
MAAKRRIWNNILRLGCALALVSGLWACVSGPAAIITGVQPPVWDPADQQAWGEGFRAFEEGDYAWAASIFETLGASAQTREIGRRALFGLAATRLILAHTPEEYAEAVSAWEYWSGQARSGLQGEDPRMLTPFVARLAALHAEKNDPVFEQPRRVPKDASNGGAGYKGTLQSKEKEVEGLRAKLEAREREVRRLRHQLESLEEIHRKYQEKKQEASSP